MTTRRVHAAAGAALFASWLLAPTPAQAVVTRVTMAVDSTEITAGNAPTISGTVTDENDAPVAGATVQLMHIRYGETSWSSLATVTTDAEGRYTYRARPMTQTRVGARSDEVSTPSVLIRVHRRVNIRTSAAGETTLTFRGDLLPNAPGLTVGIGRAAADRPYQYLASTRNTASGFELRVPNPHRSYTYYVYVSASGGLLRGVSSVTV